MSPKTNGGKEFVGVQGAVDVAHPSWDNVEGQTMDSASHAVSCCIVNEGAATCRISLFPSSDVLLQPRASRR